MSSWKDDDSSSFEIEEDDYNDYKEVRSDDEYVSSAQKRKGRKKGARRGKSVMDTVSMFNRSAEFSTDGGGSTIVDMVAKKGSNHTIRIAKDRLPSNYNPKLGRGLSSEDFGYGASDDEGILPTRPLKKVTTKEPAPPPPPKAVVKEAPKVQKPKAAPTKKKKPYRTYDADDDELKCPLNLIPGIPLPGDSLKKDPLGSLQVKFDDVYKLTEEINSGAFGVVYKGYHVSSGPEALVAIKVVDRVDDEQDDDVINETQMLKDIRTLPHIVRLFDFYMDEEKMYIVQELAAGGDVFDRLIEKKTYNEGDARELCEILLSTMQQLHGQKIIHRDLKPENLLLKDTGSDTGILLCDFGFAKALPADGSGLMTTAGTPMFTAPEIVNGQSYKLEVDMWSIGCIIFMLLGGYQPFDADTDEETYEYIAANDWGFDDGIWDVVSNEAKSVIQQMLTLDTNERLTADDALQTDWFTQCKKFKLKKNNLSKAIQGHKKYNETVRQEEPYLDKSYKGDQDYLYFDPWKFVNEEAAKKNWLRPLGLHLGRD